MSSSSTNSEFRQQGRSRRDGKRQTSPGKKNKYLRKFQPEMVLIRPDSKSREYIRRFGIKKRAPKWGQMKLLMGEIQWLVNHWDREKHPKIILVVAGGATGNHYRDLTDMFPDIERVDLWDDGRFAVSEGPNSSGHPSRIRLVRQRMTVERAMEAYNNSTDNLPIFFASDLRSISHTMTKDDGGRFTEQEVEEGVWRDHLLQWNLMMAINPVSAMLKLRLPYYLPNSKWQPLSVNYLAGYIYGQCFAPPTSTETRLIPIGTPGPDGKMIWKTTNYSVKEYEEKLFYYNTTLRDDWEVRDNTGQEITIDWLNTVNGVTGVPDNSELINGFDSVYAIHILDRYLHFIGDTDRTDTNDRFFRVMVVWNWLRDSINETMIHKASLKTARENAHYVPQSVMDDEDGDDEDIFITSPAPSTPPIPTSLSDTDINKISLLPGTPGQRPSNYFDD